MQPVLLSDRYLHQHVAYIVREYRVLAYSQFLEAYKRCVWKILYLGIIALITD
jgi:hypothetical protein